MVESVGSLAVLLVRPDSSSGRLFAPASVHRGIIPRQGEFSDRPLRRDNLNARFRPSFTTPAQQEEENMNHLSVGDLAPDFTLPDHQGTPFTLSEICRSHNVLLVFNLGFV